MSILSETIDQRLPYLNDLFEDSDVHLAYLFGSTLEGKQANDVDIAVLFNTYSFERYLEIQEHIQKRFDNSRVDVLVLNRSNAALKLNATLGGKILYAKYKTLDTDFITDSLWEYEDFSYFLCEYRRLFRQRVQRGISMDGRKINRMRVETQLSKLDEAVAYLARLRGGFSSYEDFYDEVDKRELCVHYLRIALESVLDICRHFLAVVGVNLSELDTTSLIVLAGEKGLMAPDFARKIRGMAGMRNAIVHVYWQLDYEAIYKAVTLELGDFDEFVRQVQAHFIERD